VSGSLRPAVLNRALSAESRRLGQTSERLTPGLARVVDAKREALGRRSDRLSLRPILRDLNTGREKLDALSRRLSDAGRINTKELRDRLQALDRLRETLSYKATLDRGYAVVRGDGNVVTTKDAAENASGLEIEFKDGRIKIGGSAAGKRKSGTPKPPEQGSLF
jgi:exodeoxyribonuclease VII large subunit